LAEIKPFKGYLPPSDIASKVSSPPYDVMSSDEARLMIQNNSQSFLRIIKPEIDFETGSEPKGDLLHKHGRDNLQKFIDEGLLVEDKNKCFYIYQIQMENHTQTGIMGTVSVDEYNKGIIKKHEFTKPDKENDRTRHIEITNANTGPVFLTFKNDGQFRKKISKIKNQSQDIYFTADDDTIHTLWKTYSSDQIGLLSDYFQSITALYIADGHHRAASASRVQKNRQDTSPKHIGSESYNYFLAVIFPDDEMQILDYNRVVNDLNGLTEKEFFKSIEPSFLVFPYHSPFTPNKPNIISIFLNKKWYYLEAKDHIKSNDPVKGLEASILQNHLLTPILGIDDPRTNKRIDFIGGIRGLKELERRCQTDCVIAFALPPISIEQLLSVADSGDVMPPKSTWFEPKLRSGMVVRLIN
jgi:uncharacterized protein (DUF1015 family)